MKNIRKIFFLRHGERFCISVTCKKTKTKQKQKQKQKQNKIFHII